MPAHSLRSLSKPVESRIVFVRRGLVGHCSLHAVQDSVTRPIPKCNLPFAVSAGLAAGANADQLVAMEMGADSVSELTDIQKEYLGKMQEKLSTRARELRQEEEERKLREARNFELGKSPWCNAWRCSVMGSVDV